MKVKAFYRPGIGYLLYYPDGRPLDVPNMGPINISEEVIDAISKCGKTRFAGEVIASISFPIEIVNVDPDINLKNL